MRDPTYPPPRPTRDADYERDARLDDGERWWRLAGLAAGLSYEGEQISAADIAAVMAAHGCNFLDARDAIREAHVQAKRRAH